MTDTTDYDPAHTHPIFRGPADLPNHLSLFSRMPMRRIGDAVMTHLLLYSAIFVALPNNCYMQVCGMSAGSPSPPSFPHIRLYPGWHIHLAGICPLTTRFILSLRLQFIKQGHLQVSVC